MDRVRGYRVYIVQCATVQRSRHSFGACSNACILAQRPLIWLPICDSCYAGVHTSVKVSGLLISLSAWATFTPASKSGFSSHANETWHLSLIRRPGTLRIVFLSQPIHSTGLQSFIASSQRNSDDVESRGPSTDTRQVFLDDGIFVGSRLGATDQFLGIPYAIPP
jgi:hypothetical protein